MISLADQESLHPFCKNNRALLQESTRAGCFYCQALFAPAEISDWVDGLQRETGSTDDGVTALCPRCGIDAVLPNAIPTELTAKLLADMHAHWFQKRNTDQRDS